MEAEEDIHIEPRSGPGKSGLHRLLTLSMRGFSNRGRLPGDLSYFLREVRRRPPSFLLRKAGSEVSRWARTGLAAVGQVPYQSRRSGWRPGALGSLLPGRDLDAALDVLSSHRPEELDTLGARADRLARGELEIFSRTVPTSGGIDWHCDFVSGRRWPTKFHGRYSYAEILDHRHASDVKVPWELSRLQWLPILALAYRLGSSQLHLSSLIDTLSDWDRANPVGFGINWTVGMEVALRAVNLIWTAELLAGTAAVGRLEETRLGPLLVEHGKFLARNLEYSDINGNHYTSCLLGLLYLGLYLAEEPEASAWVETGLAELDREILAQTYPDGVCHEGSIPYHRLILELFLHAALLCRRHALPIGKLQLRRLEKMVEFTAAYTKPNGLAPVWGDTDDGRVLTLGSQNINDHRYLVSLGGVIFGRADFLEQAGPLSLDAALLLDEDLLREFKTFSTSTTSARQGRSQSFPEGGFFILRNLDDYCLVDCGDVGLRGRGGHGHNDALSIELSLGRLDVLTDTGSSSYTRSIKARVRSISARAHNVATVDGEEPAPISFDRLPHATDLPVELLAWEPTRSRFEGLHKGFPGIDSLVAYQRAVELLPEGRGIAIEDGFRGYGPHTLEWRFHFDQVWSVQSSGPKRIHLGGTDSATLQIRWELPGEGEYALGDESFHPTYDAHRKRTVLAIQTICTFPATATFRLCRL